MVDAALDDARAGDNRAAAERMREAFGSRCDGEFPEPREGERTNRCLRREPEYDGARETVGRREARTE